jgi:hypothetical protein
MQSCAVVVDARGRKGFDLEGVADGLRSCALQRGLDARRRTGDEILMAETPDIVVWIGRPDPGIGRWSRHFLVDVRGATEFRCSWLAGGGPSQPELVRHRRVDLELLFGQFLDVLIGGEAAVDRIGGALQDSLGVLVHQRTELLERLLREATGDLEEARRRIRQLEAMVDVLLSARAEPARRGTKRALLAGAAFIVGAYVGPLIGHVSDATWAAIGPADRSAVEQVVEDAQALADACATLNDRDDVP